MAAILIISGAMELLFTSCQSGGRKSSSPEATAMIIAASEAKDNERVLFLADSLEQAGKISKGESNYWQGYAHYQKGEREQAKSFSRSFLYACEGTKKKAECKRKARFSSFEEDFFVFANSGVCTCYHGESARVTSGSLHVQARKPNITGWTNPMHK